VSPIPAELAIGGVPRKTKTSPRRQEKHEGTQRNHIANHQTTKEYKKIEVPRTYVASNASLGVSISIAGFCLIVFFVSLRDLRGFVLKNFGSWTAKIPAFKPVQQKID
jgi:hypothetical protein